jgi:hypothetical protein
MPAVAAAPNVELWIARTGIVIALFICVAITTVGVQIARHYVRLWRTQGFNDVSSNLWIALTFTVVLDIFLFAVMDIGQAFALVVDGWGGIVGISTALLGFAFGYKATTKIVGTKGGNFDNTPSGNAPPGGG